MYNYLRCPYCNGSFAPPNNNYDILTCHCSQYPVIDGIPIIKKGMDRVVGMVLAGKRQQSLLTMLRPHFGKPNAPYPIRKFLLRQLARDWDRRATPILNDKNVTAAQLIELYFDKSKRGRNARDYFKYRFGQTRHLVSLSLASIIPGNSRPVLDLGCGFGHITHGICHLVSQPVIGIDCVFYLLYVAKQRIAPQADYVCCDANCGLPFSDAAFSTVTSSNAFHFIEKQLFCFRELKRISDGPIILVSVRHSGIRSNVPNSSLSLDGYKSILGDMSCCFVSDNEILERYINKLGPNLVKPSNALESEALFSIVASPEKELFREYGVFNEWPHARGKIRINPLYKKNGNKYLLEFPSDDYRIENNQYYLPASNNSQNIEELIDQCVMIGMPDNYC